MGGNDKRCVTFRDFFRRDADDPRAFFDTGAFADILDIDGHKVTGLLLKDTNINAHAPDTEGYSQQTARLYLRSKGISGVNAGQSIRVNGVVYTVKSHDVLGGYVHRIMLEGADP